jgi:hypothetical protein
MTKLLGRILLGVLLATGAGATDVRERTPLISGASSNSSSNNASTMYPPDNLGAWTLVVQGSDQDVTNSITTVSTNLCLPMATAKSYEWQATIKYSTNGATPGDTPGIRYNFSTLPALTTLGGVFIYNETIAASGATLAGIVNTAYLPTTDSAGGGLANLARPLVIRMRTGILIGPAAAAGGNVCVVFANNIAGGGLTTRIWAASSLSWREVTN